MMNRLLHVLRRKSPLWFVLILLMKLIMKRVIRLTWVRCSRVLLIVICVVCVVPLIGLRSRLLISGWRSRSGSDILDDLYDRKVLE